MGQIKITESHGYYELQKVDTGETILVQTDWDYPSLASNLGWQPCHNSTDGTIDCPECGNTASAMIMQAQNFIDEHQGETFEDPGYFN